MTWLTDRIRWVMVIAGVLTATMVSAAVDPQAALQSMFGETLTGPVAELVVRNWGALIALVGGMLIWGAFHPPSRPLALVVASVSKLCFIGLVLATGLAGRTGQVRVSIVVDAIFVLAFAIYLARELRSSRLGHPGQGASP